MIYLIVAFLFWCCVIGLVLAWLTNLMDGCPPMMYPEAIHNCIAMPKRAIMRATGAEEKTVGKASEDELVEIILTHQERDSEAMEFVREVARGAYPDSDKASLLEALVQRAKAILERSQREPGEVVTLSKGEYDTLMVAYEFATRPQQGPMKIGCPECGGIMVNITGECGCGHRWQSGTFQGPPTQREPGEDECVYCFGRRWLWGYEMPESGERAELVRMACPCREDPPTQREQDHK